MVDPRTKQDDWPGVYHSSVKILEMEFTDHDKIGQGFPQAGPGLTCFQFFMLPVSNCHLEMSA